MFKFIKKLMNKGGDLSYMGESIDKSRGIYTHNCAARI